MRQSGAPRQVAAVPVRESHLSGVICFCKSNSPLAHVKLAQAAIELIARSFSVGRLWLLGMSGETESGRSTREARIYSRGCAALGSGWDCQGGFCSKYRDICKKTNAADRPIRVIARRDELIRASLGVWAAEVKAADFDPKQTPAYLRAWTLLGGRPAVRQRQQPSRGAAIRPI